MGDIKFRAWGSGDECMFYQADCYESDEFGFQFTPDGLELLVIDEKWESGSGEWQSHEYMRSVDDAIFMQSTGIKDKNGVEVYEGDIVMCYPDEINICYSKVVEWDSDAPILGITTNGRSGATLCKGNQGILWIIGNIHQNPELLEE